MSISLDIILTETAKKHLKKITNDNVAIHLDIKKSGCSGFSYVLTTNDFKNINHDEIIFKIQEIPFVISKSNILAFKNCIIDYKKEGLNYKIIFDNPNTSNHCGCGESFNFLI